jgi:hypothetical protein
MRVGRLKPCSTVPSPRRGVSGKTAVELPSAEVTTAALPLPMRPLVGSGRSAAARSNWLALAVTAGLGSVAVADSSNTTRWPESPTVAAGDVAVAQPARAAAAAKVATSAASPLRVRRR